MSNGAHLTSATSAIAPPLFLPRPEIMYIYICAPLFLSRPEPRTYLVSAPPLLSPDGRQWLYQI